jgi:SAM-dependent methyltransferase
MNGSNGSSHGGMLGESALPGPLVCQETLQPLEVVDDGLWSSGAQRLYPVRGGLVYMGYPHQDQAMIEATMTEEREWQGTVATLERDAEFLRQSAPQAVRFINLISTHAPTRGRVLELGAGSGWVSWLLARAGYDTYLCDFEANSLALGLEYEHPRMDVGRRIVVDARYAPFADGSFDVVFLKEFVHHVADYQSLFREANRVLRAGGLLAFQEPTMNLFQRVYQIRHPDPVEGHHIEWPERYLRSISKAGFEAIHLGAIFYERVPRSAIKRALRRSALRRTDGDRALDTFGRIHLSLLGDAQFVVIARKTRDAAPMFRPPMRVIDPATMTTSQQDREIYRQLCTITEQAAEDLRAPASQRPLEPVA